MRILAFGLEKFGVLIKTKCHKVQLKQTLRINHDVHKSTGEMKTSYLCGAIWRLTFLTLINETEMSISIRLSFECSSFIISSSSVLSFCNGLAVWQRMET